MTIIKPPNPMTPSPTFHPFPRLPTELRLQIFHLAIPDGVYIHLSRHPLQENVSQHLISRCSTHPVPPLLHVNSEARFVALPYFHILGTGPSRTYFNPAADTLMLGLIFRTNCEALVRYPKMILGEGVGEVRRITVYNEPVYGNWFTPLMLRSYPALEGFSVLDLGEWEVGTRKRTGMGLGQRGGNDYEALRYALSPEVFRGEDLVRLGEIELIDEVGMQEFVSVGRRLRFAWLKATGESDGGGLDSRVLRLRFPGVEVWEGMREKMRMKEDDTRGSGEGEVKRKGLLQKRWRSLVKFCEKIIL